MTEATIGLRLKSTFRGFWPLVLEVGFEGPRCAAGCGFLPSTGIQDPRSILGAEVLAQGFFRGAKGT